MCLEGGRKFLTEERTDISHVSADGCCVWVEEREGRLGIAGDRVPLRPVAGAAQAEG